MSQRTPSNHPVRSTTGPTDRHTALRALLVDFDGLLIDSEYANFLAWQEEFTRHDTELRLEEWARHWANNMAGPADKIPTMCLLHRRARRPVDETVSASRRRARYEELVAEMPARHGPIRWIRDAYAVGVPCVIVTNGDAARVHAMLAPLGIAGAVTDVQCRTPGLAAKPAPDLYTAALHRLTVGCDQAVAVEDSPHGVESARAAGLRCVGVPNRVTAYLDLSRANIVIRTPEALNLAGLLGWLRMSRPAPAGLTLPALRHRRQAERILGSLGGLALGDAVGKLIDKRPADRLDPTTQHMLDRVGVHADPPESFAGRVTDDTVLTLALIDVLLSGPREIRTRYEARLREIDPRGGKQIHKLKASRSPLHVADDGATNGCVPRSAALAYAYTPAHLGDLCYDVVKVATLTHGHPEALTAALLLAVSIACAVAEQPPEQVRETLTGMGSTLERIAGGGREVHQTLHRCLADSHRFATLEHYVDHLETTVGMAVQAGSSSVTGISLALTASSFHAVLPVLLRRREEGWDLDSTAAIYGALAGAFRPDAIPESWTRVVERFTRRSFARLAAGLDDRCLLSASDGS